MNMKAKRRYQIYDAFPTKAVAQSNAKDLRRAGETAQVRKINQDGGRLKFGLFTAGKRKNKR